MSAPKPLDDLPLLILAGGRATRLGALSQTVPKFLMPVGAGQVFADVQLRWARQQGFRKVVLCVNHLAEQIEAYCQDGRRYDLSITYMHDGPDAVGTGGAIRNACVHLNHQYAAVTYGDTLLNFEVGAVYQRALQQRSIALMTLLADPPKEHRPNAKLLPDGKVLYSKAQPDPTWRHIDYGFIILDRAAFLERTRTEAFDLGFAMEAIGQAGELDGYLVSEVFREIGTIDALAHFRQTHDANRQYRGLIVLDRDGVLNAMVVDPEHGTVNSPLHPDQVEVFPWVADCLRDLTEYGFALAIATNQPAAAKGTTTLRNLEAVHERVLDLAQAKGGKILSSHICFRTAKDPENRRKPKPDLLLEALRLHDPERNWAEHWMVGDGATDVQAGVAAGFQTAFIGPKRCDHCKVLETLNLSPQIWTDSLADVSALLCRVR